MRSQRQLVEALRADRRPRLIHRLDVFLELLKRARGACSAVAQIVAAAKDGSEDERSSSLNQPSYRPACARPSMASIRARTLRRACGGP